MEAKLSNEELKSLAKSVSDNIIETLTGDLAVKMLEDAAKKRIGIYIEYYLSDNILTCDAETIMRPTIEKIIRESKEVEKQLHEFTNSEQFKKLEMKHLKLRMEALQQEIEDLEDND